MLRGANKKLFKGRKRFGGQIKMFLKAENASAGE